MQNVVDYLDDPSTTLGDFRTSANHPQKALKDAITNGSSVDATPIYDYQYDGNGNMVTYYNKDFVDGTNQGIVYNYLNLPQTITVTNPIAVNVINYVYDATGNKVIKKVTEPSKETTTTYFAGIVYQHVDVITGPASPTELQFINHEEGRIRYVKHTDDNGIINFFKIAYYFCIIKYSVGFIFCVAIY